MLDSLPHNRHIILLQDPQLPVSLHQHSVSWLCYIGLYEKLRHRLRIVTLEGLSLCGMFASWYVLMIAYSLILKIHHSSWNVSTKSELDATALWAWCIETVNSSQRLKSQCTLDYPGADYSICGLSVLDYVFNLPSIWFIKLRAINTYTEYLVDKRGYVLVWLSPGAWEHTGSGSVWEKHVFQSVSSWKSGRCIKY
jgi:hypothetical protein